MQHVEAATRSRCGVAKLFAIRGQAFVEIVGVVPPEIVDPDLRLIGIVGLSFFNQPIDPQFDRTVIQVIVATPGQRHRLVG